MQFEKAYDFLIPKLEKELPKHLYYHNAGHTKDIIGAVQYLCREENINGHDLEILSTAALFHDAGFLETYSDHEEASCLIARKYLPDFEYTQTEIDEICELIMFTKMPQSPNGKLSKIICDADLLYLGTERYYQVAESLFEELKHMSLIKNWNQWRQTQIDFLESHHYFTETANKEISLKKMHNLLLFKSKGSAHKWNENLYNWLNGIQDSILILIGVLAAGFAIKGFLLPSHFFDGGITGISFLNFCLMSNSISISSSATNIFTISVLVLIFLLMK